MPAILSDSVSDLIAAADKLRADDRLITSPHMLLGDVEALLDVVTTTHAVLVRRLREAIEVGASSEVAGRSTRAFLTDELLLARAEATKLMRLTLQLPEFPDTQHAFDTAQISTAHTVAILTALRHLPPDIRDTVEPHLIERAKFHPPEEIAGFVDELLERLGIDKDADIRRERRHAERGVDLARTLDDARAINGTLTPDVAEQVEQAFALAGQPTGAEDDRSLRQRQHDALGAIAAHYLAHHQTPSFAGAPRSVIVTIDLETLENQLREGWLTLPSGAVISADTARRLACDAELIPVVLGSRSEVLDIGQADHEFTTAIRRAAYLRDGGRCAFPNCHNKVSQLHHIFFRRHGGPTCLENAAWVCHYHHWLVHEGRWTLIRRDDGNYLWTAPDGRQRIRHL